ncbi:MAG: DUF4253 domain-containing protein, partial [Polyangiaceae bacterium]|nr:DUF4253 domain-containing protein [Polyangiaceae bacterium]
EEAGAEEREPLDAVLRLAEALDPDPAAWAKRRDEELAAQLRAAGFEASLERPEPDESPSDDAAPFAGFATPNDLVTGRPHPLVAVALFPVHAGFEVPALVGWGGWNACPYPEEHVSLLRHFHERFGAELVCMTQDVLELEVTRPPAHFEDALPLARLMHAYCPDIVEQGVGSVGALASGLVGGTSWFFWWD